MYEVEKVKRRANRMMGARERKRNIYFRYRKKKSG